MLLETLQNSQENICTRVSFLIKLQVLSATLSKKRLWHRCFLVYFAKHLPYRTPPGNCFLRRRFAQKTKQKNHSKTQLGKKSLPFHDDLYHIVFLYFFTALLAAFAQVFFVFFSRRLWTSFLRNLFCLKIFVSLCRSGSWNFLTRNNVAAPKKWRAAVVLEINRKLTCGSKFFNVGGCKTQTYLRLQLTKNGRLL